MTSGSTSNSEILNKFSWLRFSSFLIFDQSTMNFVNFRRINQIISKFRALKLSGEKMRFTVSIFILRKNINSKLFIKLYSRTIHWMIFFLNRYTIVNDSTCRFISGKILFLSLYPLFCLPFSGYAMCISLFLLCEWPWLAVKFSSLSTQLKPQHDLYFVP